MALLQALLLLELLIFCHAIGNSSRGNESVTELINSKNIEDLEETTHTEQTIEVEEETTTKMTTTTTAASVIDSKVSVKMPSGAVYRIRDPDVTKHINCDKPDFIDVSPVRKEYRVLLKELQSELRITHLLKLQRIINRCLWTQYSFFRDLISHRSEAKANETFLFTAFTGYIDLMTVPTKGYDERISGSTVADQPNGLYLVSKMPDGKEFPKGERIMYMNRVACGSMYHMNSSQSMLYPPPGYQSLSVNLDNITQFVVPSGYQIYPEYYIEFKS